METINASDVSERMSPLIDSAYRLTPTRIAEVAVDTAALGARVMSLAQVLPFEAEPWGFGGELLLLAKSNES